MMMRTRDMRSEPVRRVVALGESTTWGYSVSHKDKCWVNRTVRMIEEFQGEKVDLINQGIGSNVLTTRCPAYEHSAKPAALERVAADVIELKPDLLFISYGLNDSRGGTTPEVFREEYQKLINAIRAEINPVIVALNVYYMHEVCYLYEGWDHADYEVNEVYNLVIKQLAEKNGLILADIYSAEVGVDWFVDEDHCHPNDLGHLIVANRVFEAVARNCSFVARTNPAETLIGRFATTYGNGPDRPSSSGETTDAMNREGS